MSALSIEIISVVIVGIIVVIAIAKRCKHEKWTCSSKEETYYCGGPCCDPGAGGSHTKWVHTRTCLKCGKTETNETSFDNR